MALAFRWIYIYKTKSPPIREAISLHSKLSVCVSVVEPRGTSCYPQYISLDKQLC